MTQKLLVGLIGAGIQRSLSPALQEEEARHHGLRLHYQLIDLDAAGVGVEALPELIRAVRIMRFAGLNITFPCKQAVIPLLDALSEEARAIGAVNTVVREGEPPGRPQHRRLGLELGLPARASRGRSVARGAARRRRRRARLAPTQCCAWALGSSSIVDQDAVARRRAWRRG